jgi:hypothetical protein
VLGEKVRLTFDDLRESTFEALGDAVMKLFTLAAQQRAICGISYEGMLE